MGKQSDTSRMKAMVVIQFTGVEAEIKKLEKQAKTLGVAIPKGMIDGFKKVGKQVGRIKDELRAASDEDTFKMLQVSMSLVVDEADKLGVSIAKIQGKKGAVLDVGRTTQATLALKKYRNEMRQVAMATQRTSMSSQNMLRIIQDSPFGMLGMANNIQMLGEDISRGLAKGTSAAQTLKAALKNLIMGPMAIAAVIAIGTIIIQKWDAISEAATRLGEKLKGLTEDQRALNKAMRAMGKIETFEKFLGEVERQDLYKVRQMLNEDEMKAQKQLIDAGIVDIELFKNQTRLVGAVAAGAEMLGIRAEVLTLNAKRMLKDWELIQERQVALSTTMTKQAELDELMHRAGLETDYDKAGQKAAEKAGANVRETEKQAAATMKRLLRQAFKYNTEFAKSEKEFLVDQARVRREHDEAVAEDRIKSRAAQRKAMQADMREASRVVRQGMATLRGEMQAGMVEASVIGQNALGVAAYDISRGERLDRIRAEAIFAKAVIDEKIDIQRDGIREMDDMISRANNADRARLLADQRKMMALIIKFEADRVTITDKSEELIRKTKHDNRMEDLQSLAGISSQMGSIFGSLSVTMATEGEKGLEAHKGMLRAAAWAEAIAAGISVFRGIVWSNPLNVVGAGVAMAAVIAGLTAKIRQMDQPLGGGGSPILGGRFTALSSGAAGGRVRSYQLGQDRLNQTQSAGQDRAAENLTDEIRTLGENLRTQKVVIDPTGMAEVTRQGTKTNTRLVQSSD